jgi:hypothetical protein
MKKFFVIVSVILVGIYSVLKITRYVDGALSRTRELPVLRIADTNGGIRLLAMVGNRFDVEWRNERHKRLGTEHFRASQDGWRVGLVRMPAKHQYSDGTDQKLAENEPLGFGWYDTGEPIVTFVFQGKVDAPNDDRFPQGLRWFLTVVPKAARSATIVTMSCEPTVAELESLMATLPARAKWSQTQLNELVDSIVGPRNWIGKIGLDRASRPYVPSAGRVQSEASSRVSLLARAVAARRALLVAADNTVPRVGTVVDKIRLQTLKNSSRRTSSRRRRMSRRSGCWPRLV